MPFAGQADEVHLAAQQSERRSQHLALADRTAGVLLRVDQQHGRRHLGHVCDGRALLVERRLLPRHAAQLVGHGRGRLRREHHALEVADVALRHGGPEAPRGADQPEGHEPAVALAHDPDALGVHVGPACGDLDGGHQVARVDAAPIRAVGQGVGLAVALAATRVHEQDPVALFGKPPHVVAEALAQRPVRPAVDVQDQRQALGGWARCRVQDPRLDRLAVRRGEVEPLQWADGHIGEPCGVEIRHDPFALAAPVGVQHRDLARIVGRGEDDRHLTRSGRDAQAVDGPGADRERRHVVRQRDVRDAAGAMLRIGDVAAAPVRIPGEVRRQERARRVRSDGEADRPVEVGGQLARFGRPGRSSWDPGHVGHPQFEVEALPLPASVADPRDPRPLRVGRPGVDAHGTRGLRDQRRLAAVDRHGPDAIALAERIADTPRRAEGDRPPVGRHARLVVVALPVGQPGEAAAVESHAPQVRASRRLVGHHDHDRTGVRRQRGRRGPRRQAGHRRQLAGLDVEDVNPAARCEQDPTPVGQPARISAGNVPAGLRVTAAIDVQPGHPAERGIGRLVEARQHEGEPAAVRGERRLARPLDAEGVSPLDRTASGTPGRGRGHSVP